jgi:hypothetical protein
MKEIGTRLKEFKQGAKVIFSSDQRRYRISPITLDQEEQYIYATIEGLKAVLDGHFQLERIWSIETRKGTPPNDYWAYRGDDVLVVRQPKTHASSTYKLIWTDYEFKITVIEQWGFFPEEIALSKTIKKHLNVQDYKPLVGVYCPLSKGFRDGNKREVTSA